MSQCSAKLESVDVLLGEKWGCYEKAHARIEGISISTHVEAKADLHCKSDLKMKILKLIHHYQQCPYRLINYSN